MANEKIVSVFGSGTLDPQGHDYQNVIALGRELALEGYTICCGGYGGVMEAVAKGARQENGKVIGVILKQFGPPNPWITKVIVTSSLFERLQYLLTLPQAYVVMCGSTGTLVELCLAWELINKRFIRPSRPIIIAHPAWLPIIAEFMKLLDSSPPLNPHFPFPAPDYFYYADNVPAIKTLLRELIP